jgi:hypothetical protein
VCKTLLRVDAPLLQTLKQVREFEVRHFNGINLPYEVASLDNAVHLYNALASAWKDDEDALPIVKLVKGKYDHNVPLKALSKEDLEVWAREVQVAIGSFLEIMSSKVNLASFP